MSDDDAPPPAVAAVSCPPPNCAEDATSPTDDGGSHALEQSDGNEHPTTVVDEAKVKTPSVENEAKADDEAGAVVELAVPRTDDHEISKEKRKCVQFGATLPGATDDVMLRKFIEGDEILDKRNPFKVDDHSMFENQYHDDIERDTMATSNAPEIDMVDGNDDNESEENDNEFITKEEILRQSKYVKTYIKNPDKQLNYDKSVIQKLNAIKAKGREVRDVVVVDGSPPLRPPNAQRPPIPAPRAIHRQSDRNNNNRRQQHCLPQQLTRIMGNPKPTPRARCDYAEVKVRTGSADAEESLYDSNEVVLNALKFDSRFRRLEFGSQDDIDTIAEKTEDAEAIQETDGNVANGTATEKQIVLSSSSPTKGGNQTEGKKSSFAEDVKKSFSNTVKSADFMKYLQSKGLSLVPAKHQNRSEVKAKGRPFSGVPLPTPPPRQPTKLSVLTKFLQNSLFTPKTPNDPAYSIFPRSSTPVHYGTQGGQTHARAQLLPRTGSAASYNGPLVKRSTSVDVKPKVSFKQLDHVDAGLIKRPASVNDFDRPKLRTNFANRSMSRIDSAKRSMKNAGVQVNIATNGGGNSSPHNSVATGKPQRPGSWQPVGTAVANGSAIRQHMPTTVLRHRLIDPLYAGTSSLHTVAPLYSEPLRDSTMLREDAAMHRSTVDSSGYHIYEQTPDNLRREMLYGKIGGYLSNGQLSNGWHAQDRRRSYSSMQEGPTGGNGVVGNATYGRLRPTYVSSPLSTQSTPVRRGSETLDREQILHRIYDFCRRSIRNSSKTSVHSNQTEPLYQTTSPPSVRMVGSGSFPVERPRVQRVQSLTNPRSSVGMNYTRVVVPGAVIKHPAGYVVGPRATLPTDARRNQHNRNIENIYAFVNKKMSQMSIDNVDGSSSVGGAVSGSTMSIQTAPSTLRRVTFSSRNGPADSPRHGLEEADYVNIRGAPDGVQYRTTQC